MTNFFNRVLILVVFALSATLSLRADDKKDGAKPGPVSVPVPTGAPSGPTEVEVGKIQDAYWTRGNEEEIGVVQNRLYTNKKKIELGVHLGTLAGDPFLVAKSLILTAGYHFTEYVSVHANYWKNFVSASSALKALESTSGQTANTNEPGSYFGVEGKANLLYGKLSLLGKKIMYFDAYVTTGVGLMNTESGKNLTLSFGFGQQIHLSQLVALDFGYKVLWYRETILGKNTGVNANLGQNLGSRSNVSSLITVGVSFVLDPHPAQAVPADKN